MANMDQMAATTTGPGSLGIADAAAPAPIVALLDAASSLPAITPRILVMLRYRKVV
jgi:hypothetical protein